MQLTTTYIMSQIFSTIYYMLLVVSYQLKDRNKILILNYIGLISTGISLLLLNAYTGLAMIIVSIIRTTVFLIDEKLNGKQNIIKTKDIIILIVLYLIMIISTLYTYSGPLSIIPLISTMIYTYSIWQKNTKVYKLLGIPHGILITIYSIYIVSITAIIFEIISTISAIIGIIKENKL